MAVEEKEAEDRAVEDALRFSVALVREAARGSYSKAALVA